MKRKIRFKIFLNIFYNFRLSSRISSDFLRSNRLVHSKISTILAKAFMPHQMAKIPYYLLHLFDNFSIQYTEVCDDTELIDAAKYEKLRRTNTKLLAKLKSHKKQTTESESVVELNDLEFSNVQVEEVALKGNDLVVSMPEVVEILDLGKENTKTFTNHPRKTEERLVLEKNLNNYVEIFNVLSNEFTESDSGQESQCDIISREWVSLISEYDYDFQCLEEKLARIAELSNAVEELEVKNDRVEDEKKAINGHLEEACEKIIEAEDQVSFFKYF